MAITLEEIAERVGARLQGDGTVRIERCAGLEEAGTGELTFLANARYASRLAATRASAVVLSPKHAEAAPASLNLLVAEDPYFAFREAVVAVHGFRRQPPPGVSPGAHVDPAARLGEDVHVGTMAVIEAGAEVGARSVIYPHAYIGRDAVVGEGCILYPQVVVYEQCVLGDRVILHAGTVIGQDGFGYATHAGAHHKIPQVGNVVVEDDVEMGANCAVDRATVGSTVIGRGTKCSDLVAIGHGSRVGAHNLLVALVGLAGSVRTGRYVVIGGQTGVAGHLEIGEGVQIAAQSGVAHDLAAGAQYGGMPAQPFGQAKRSWFAVQRLPEMLRQLRSLSARVQALEQARGEEGAPPREED